MSDVDLIINVHTNGIKDVANLSASVKALTANLREITIPMSKLDVQSRAVNKALGMTNRGMGDHAKTIKGLKENQRALGEESKRLKVNIIAYTGAIRAAGGPTTALGKELTSTKTHLQAMSASMRGARVRAFGSDISSVSLRMQKMGKDAQFVGRSLMINLTAPIMLFARLGFQALLSIDKESTRLAKVFDSVAMSAEQAAMKIGLLPGQMPSPEQAGVIDKMVSSFKQLDSALTGVSSEFGVSKDVVVGLASDFAELGIVSADNIVQLTTLTTTIEKLGGMDIGPSKDLSQALYFNARRAFEANGAFKKVTDSVERETMAIKAAQTQLAMFNAIENVTALTLQDLANALPEVGSMATAFGLSMTEAAAMLAPMKAAGLDVGASATSIKTSLQRLILPTAKNIKFMAQLAAQYGVTSDATDAFKNTTKTGLVGLEALVDVFSKVKDSAAGTEGALKLMSQLFEKRQGPRMYIAIEQLALFNKQLNTATRISGSAVDKLASPAEKAIATYNKLNKTTLKETIDNFKDIGILARVASGTVGQTVDGYKGKGAGGTLSSIDIGGAKAARTAVADKVREDRSKGVDSFAGVTSEAGRAMLVELAGPTTAAEIASQELDVSLKSLSVSVQKIKNNFKLFAAEILTAIGPAIKWLSAKLEQFQKYWDGLAQSTKDNVAKVIGIVLLLLAAIGPFVIAMGTMQASIGVLGRGFAHFLPKIKNAEGGIVSFGSSAEAARHKIDAFYNKLRNMKSGALGGLSSAGMASMGTLDAAGIAANQASGTVGQAVRAGAAVNLAGNVAPVPEAFAHLAPGSPERAAVVAKNRAARVAHAASGRGAVDQYMRNEAQMLGAKGMRLNSAGRVIGPGSTGFVKGGKNLLEDVSQASALRESKFAARGLTRGTGGEVFRTTRKGIERQITENQGMRLARGGIAGKLTSAKLGAVEAVRSIGGAPAKAMQGYRNSVLGAKAALRAMRVEQMAQGGVGPIKMAIAAMKGFASATKLGTLALKLMKLAMVSTGIGVIIAAVGIAVLAIVKNFDKFKEAGSGAFKTIKDAFTIFKNALLEIARPFLDLFAQFGKGGAQGKSAIGGLAAAFGGIAKAVKFVANLFMKFVVGVIQPYLYMIINIVMFVVSIFTGKWGDAFGFLTAVVSQVAKFVVQAFALLVKGMISLVAFGIKLVLGYFTLIPKAVAKSFGWLSKLPGMGFLKSIGNGIDNVVDGLFHMVDVGKGAAIGAVDAIAGAITGGLDKGISKGIKKSKGAVDIFKKKGSTSAEPAGEAIADDMGDGFAKGDVGGKMKKEIEGVLQTLQDYVAGELKNAVDKYLTQAENALKKQKDAALKVFQVQIETLDKLEKAQESLTKTMAYESEKRKRIDDKALTDEQYRRNYALAVYEGRTDDARMLQLQQGADEKAFSEDIKAIETKRAEELAKENLDALKTAINEAKDAAGKFFDESLIKFQEAAALITKFPPITIQDYQDQVGKLHTITTDAALANSTEFGNMFETFVTTINDKMPNKVIGAFSMNLDDLVIEAQKKYGLGGNPDEKSIIGATLGMLADIGGTFGDKKQTVIDAFGLVSTGLVDNFTEAKTEILRVVDEEFLTPFAASSTTFVTNWETIYKQAFIDGNRSIVDSFRNTVALNKDLMAEMAKNLDPAVNKWLALKAAIDAANDAASGGGGGGTGETGTGYAPTAYDLMEIRRAKGMIEAQAGIAARPTIFAPNNAPKSGQAAAAGNAFIPKPVFVPTSATPGYKGYAKGGVIPSRDDQNGYIGSGFINAPTQEGVPALLHGGEYIINAKAVSRLGIGALEKLNNNLIPRFAKGGYVAPKKGGIPFGGEDKILANSTKKAPQALQGPYATSIPVLASPTINLKKVPIVKNNMPGEGGYSTVRTASFEIGGGELLLPTVVKGQILSNTNAFNAFANGGYKDHLGVYANSAAASKAAEVIHLSEANKFEKITKANIQRSGIYPGMGMFAPAAAPVSNEPKKYDYMKDTSLNIVEKGIFKGSNILGGIGKFAYGAADMLSQNAARVGMSLFNLVGAVTDVALPGRSLNPLTNLSTRQNDLFYGTGMSIPFVPRKYGQLTDVGTPVDVMWKQISEYERLSGEKIPAWKKVLASVSGDPAISDSIGIATMGGGSLANAAVKTATLRAAESFAGRMLLETALGEGGAMAITGKITQSATLAGSARFSTLMENKNLLGRIQAGSAKVAGKDAAPTGFGLGKLNRLVEESFAYQNPGMMSITETFGKRPSTIVADFLKGKISIPEGGFGPKAGSIGTGSFIDATVVGEASAARNGGLNMLQNIIPDFQVAKSLINSPTENLSAGINKSVLSSIGGTAARGVKTFGSVFSNLASNVRYSDAVQSTLNAGSLTLAGLSGRKGLNYGMMATGLKKAPLGISPAQLRSSRFLSDVTPYNKGQSLFDKARSMPEMLNSVSNQFKNSTILPGSAQISMIDSYMDILNNTGGDSSYGYARSLLIDNGLKSKVGSPDYSYAKHLLSEDLKGILQTYYGNNLFTPALGSADPSAIPRIIGESIDLYNQQGYILNATGLRDQAFGRFLAEFDPLSSIGTEMAPYSWEMNLRKILTQPKDAQAGFEGNLRGVFRNIQNTAETYPAIAKVHLRQLLGNDASIASDFGAQSWLNDTDSITGMLTFGDGSRFKDNHPYDLLNPGLSRVQRLARQYLLTSNLTDMPDLMNLVKDITENSSFAETTPGRDLQEYIATSRPELASFGDIAPYKSSLYVKSRLPKESMGLSSGITALSGVGSTGGGFGTLNHLVGLDETYNTLWESYRTVSSQIRGINENDNFPLWMPTWEQFDISWKQTLDDIIEDINSHASVGGSFVGGMLQGGSAKQIEDYLLTLVQKNMHDTWAGPGGTATLNGDLLNLGLGYYDQNSGRTAFDQLTGRQSRGWFYGLRNDRFIQSDRAFSPANSIYDVAAEIAATGVRQFESVGSAGSQAAVIGSMGGGTIGASYRDLTEHALQQLSFYTANVPFDEFKLSEFYLNNAADLGNASLFRKEGNIQAMLDQASSASKIPDDFTQLIDDIFGEGEDPSFISAVWRDWFSTRGTLFHASTDPKNFTLQAYTQSPFDSKMYQTLHQHSDFGQLFADRQGYGLNIGAEIVNGEIVANSVNNPKYNPALYHLSHRLVDPLKQSLIKTQGYDILQNPIVKGLTGSDILRSRQFADLLQLPDSYQIPDSPLDNIAPNLFSDFDKLNYVSTSGLYSYDFPLSPKENEWVSRFAEKMLASPLDLSKKISFPLVDGHRTLPGAKYPGLGMPGVKKDFINPSFERELKSTDSWLLALVNDMRQNISGSGTPVMRERLAFFNYLNEFLTEGTTAGGFYGQYFDPRLKNDPNQMEIFNLINDSAKATNMEVLGKETTTFPNLLPGGYTGAFARSLTAAKMLQNKKMAIADVVALYSSNVSNFAQRAAEHSLPFAPLFPDSTNDISPYTQEFVNQSTPMDSSGALRYILKPSELIKLIGDGIKAQGRIGGLLPDKSLFPENIYNPLRPIDKKYTDAYGNPRLHDLHPFKTGGYVPGSSSTPFPAMLHGGEYVINADAVRSMGVRTMQSINRSKFNVPSGSPAYSGGGSTSVSTVNINVDTFVGEEEWFKSMMKSYNVNVLPKMNKAAGNESRTFTSYNGIN